MTIKAIGKYIDLERLGRGGMAEVYTGRDPILDRRVAIKVILPHLAEEESFEERFRQEARLAAALRHPNIVQIYEFDSHKDQSYMVMEYLHGGTLKDVLVQHLKRGETLPLRKISDFLEHIANALDFAHARGTVHRDIKPSNILFSSGGDPVIVDFGIAKILDASLQLTATGGVVGSPPYMSPEQAASKPIEKHSDIYSLGVMVYEMASGRVPFMGDTITGVLMQHLNDPPPPIREFNPNIPFPVQDVITKVLAKDPGDRFASAGNFSNAFKKALDGETPVQVSLEAETVIEQPQKAEKTSPPAPDRSAVVSGPHFPKAADAMQAIIPEANLPEPAPGKRKRWPLLIGILGVVILVVGALAVFNSGGISSALGNIGGDEGEVLLYTSLDDEEAITSPDEGIGGNFLLLPGDFVAAKEGNGIFFNRGGDCDMENYQALSFPAWRGDDSNVNLEDGELSFWYQPNYDASDPEGEYALVTITLDGDSPSSIYLFFNEGYFDLNIVDDEGEWYGISANYRAPLWQNGDWVQIRAVWDTDEPEDSLQIYVDDLRVDSGEVPGGWNMGGEELAVRIFVGTSIHCGEYPANGIIDELIIRHFP